MAPGNWRSFPAWFAMLFSAGYGIALPLLRRDLHIKSWSQPAQDEGQAPPPRGDAGMHAARDNDAVRAFIQQYIDQANANVSRAESVRKFAVLDEEFSQEHGTLTPSMKVVRPKVLQRYATVIEEDLYAPKPSNKPLPATAKIIDSTLETVKKSSESVKQASEQVKQASEQMKTSVSDSIASVSEKIKKSKAEPEEGETGDSADNADNADNAADTGSKPDQPADEKNEE